MSADTFAVSTSGEDLKNRFSALAIENTDEALDLAAAGVATSNLGVAKKSQAKDRSEEIYGLEGQFDIDNAFIIFCFFEDLHRQQDFLKETWDRCKVGTCDLAVASVRTNLAFNLVRRAKEELIAILDPKRYWTPQSYQALSLTIFYENSIPKSTRSSRMIADRSL